MLEPNTNFSIPTTADSSTESYSAENDLITEKLTLDLPKIGLSYTLTELEAAGRTDVGRSRFHNEDFFIIDNQLDQFVDPDQNKASARGVYILCDGMGGHSHGEVASRLAAESLNLYFQEWWAETLPSESVIAEGVRQANQAIYSLNETQVRSGHQRMGTTLVTVLVEDTTVRFAHVGDSRLYRLTERFGLEQLTLDHEVGQREIRRGVNPILAYSRPDAYQLTQALGPRKSDVIYPEVGSLTLTEDSVLLLCSDGITDNNLLELHYEDYLVPLLNPALDLEDGVERLIDLANTYNGHDNITVVAIRARVSAPDLE
jgi:protein phosphatase